MRYKHIVFDLDGTLLDTAETALSCLQRTLNEVLGKKIPMSELRPLFGIPCHEIAQMYHVPDVEYTVKQWQEYDRQEKGNVKPFEGVIELLDLLKEQGYMLGLVTSRSRKEINEQLPMFSMENYFSTIIGSDDTVLRKPFPDPLLKYIEISKIGKEKVLYIGDSRHDMECANAAGIDCGLALWGFISGDEHPEATYYFSQPSNIVDVLSEE